MVVKSLNLEHVYANLHKQILLVQSYTECKGLEFIIKSCRLKPLEYVKKRSENIILYRQWVDEFGNSFNFVKKKINIIYNDLSIDKSMIPCTDLYYGLSIQKIASISKLVYICSGLEEDNLQQCYFLAFLGIDGYLRTYMFLYEEWHQVSPLYLGMHNLKMIASKLDIQYFLKFSKIKNIPIPCFKSEQWLTSLPATKDLMTILNKDHKMVADILKG